MSSLEETFELARAYVANPNNAGNLTITNDLKLKFYALYKQYKNGANYSKKPSALKMVQRAKWKAWKNLKNMSKEQAMKTYIDTLTKIAGTNWQKKLKSKL